MQRLVLEEILKHEDITNSELSDILHIKISSITGRTNELRKEDKKNIIIESRKRHCKSTGEMVIAWKFNKNYDLEKSHLKEEVKDLLLRQRAQSSFI